MSRRRLLALVGGAATASAAGSWLGKPAWSFAIVNGAIQQEPAKVDAAWNPLLLSREQGLLLARVAEAMIPRTDTAGAIDAKVPEYVDLAVSLESEPIQARFLSGLEAFAQTVAAATGQTPLEAPQAEFFKALEAVSDAHTEHPPELKQAARFFKDLKQRVVFGYYTSLEGRTQELGLPARVQRVALGECGEPATAGVGH